MFLKKIFCNHEYKYYQFTSPNCKDEYYLHFICKKCKKEIIVKESKLFNDYKFWKLEWKKRIACQELCPQSLKLTLPGHGCYNNTLLIDNPAASLLYNDYLNKGIDLKELERDF